MARGRGGIERGKGKLSEYEVRAKWAAWDRPEHEGLEKGGWELRMRPREASGRMKPKQVVKAPLNSVSGWVS